MMRARRYVCWMDELGPVARRCRWDCRGRQWYIRIGCGGGHIRCRTWKTVVVVREEKGVLRIRAEGSGLGRVRKKRMVKVLKSGTRQGCSDWSANGDGDEDEFVDGLRSR